MKHPAQKVLVLFSLEVSAQPNTGASDARTSCKHPPENVQTIFFVGLSQVPDLKLELKGRGLRVSGNKAELFARLVEALQQEDLQQPAF